MEIILGKTAGFCYGVERAVNGAKEEINENEDIYCLGEIVHNQTVVDDLKKIGLNFIDSIEKAKGKTIIRAHGVSKEVYEKAEEMKIKLKDLTCPSVLKIHKIADEYSKKGYFIIVTGKENHPEVIGIASYCGNKYKIIGSKEEALGLLQALEKENKILLISQTTYSSKKFDEIEEVLKNNLRDKLEVKKTICPSTEIRQKETEDIAKQVDLMIIIGDRKSSNTNKLYDISCNFCKNVVFIQNAEELDISILKNDIKVGIMAGASTPKSEISKIERIIQDIK